MTNKEAKEKLYMEWQKFLEDNIDYAGISKAYKTAFKALEEQDLTTCDDAISRREAIEAFQMFREYESNRSNKEWVDRIETILNQLPPVTPQPKTGHWTDDGHCSECGCDVPAYIIDWKWQKDMDAKYCPRCGTKMIDLQERNDKE